MSTTITYIGGPTALLEYAGLTIVTDPTFDPPQTYVNPGATTLVKTAAPGIAREELPPIDLVLLSHHGHKDNLDFEGLELLATGVTTLSTADAATELFGGGLIGLDDWESHVIGSVTVTAVPALHGPPGSERWVGRVTGFVLEADGQPTVYVSGDNASLGLVGQIAERFPGIDIALLFAGAARTPVAPGVLTLTSTDAARAARILGAARVVGLHTEDWTHFTETRADLEAAFTAAGVPLVPTPRGERVTL
ncbi:MBL fold metallo-hydrolase [Galbitalea sp. SE-J8]|uniref:MBL fold metallo-hydrolase n=1 Tax=Galbitalea sp. SE-J8 TaxID=3054952 RepID=UPI00259C917B|nr:MBL fold metallo-hydrolase [Galbitalea sp. SE-J8]MDM4762108.1 MBL fold metallo-hydrolase [Galbitalea sp. SE-J8]